MDYVDNIHIENYASMLSCSMHVTSIYATFINYVYSNNLILNYLEMFYTVRYDISTN